MDSLTLFAVPVNGAGLAAVGRYASPFNLQVRQICKSSDFIDNLNELWASEHVENTLRIKYIEGGLDNVVSPASAKSHYGNTRVETIVDKGHKNIVKPTNAEDLSFILVKQMLMAGKTLDSATRHPLEIDHLVESANQSYNQGEFNTAEQSLRKAMDLCAPSGPLTRELGKVYFAQRAFDKVAALLRDWEQLGRDADPDISCMKTEYLIRNGDPVRAVEILSQAGPRSTYNLEYLTGSAYVLSSREDPLHLVFALKHFKAATRIDPESWWARINLIYVLRMLDRRHLVSSQKTQQEIRDHEAAAGESIRKELARHPFMFSARLYRLTLAAVLDDKLLFESLITEDITFFAARSLTVNYIFPKSWVDRLKLLYGTDGETYGYYANGLYRWLSSI